MESLGLEELEELEHLIGYPRFVAGYDEQGNEINRTEFITYKQSFNEVLDKNKKLKQENQALKDKWQKLEEYIYNEKEEVKVLIDPCAEEYELLCSVLRVIDRILLEMQELEKGD